MSEPLLSIVIRCYNEEAHLGRLLSGILEQTIKNIEIIIVDSGSTDRTLLVAANFPVTICKIDPDEFSFGHALNVGCSVATADFLVFASAHVYPTHRRWLEYLLAPFSDQNVALAYGKQRGNAHTNYSEHRIFCKWFPETSLPVQKSPFCNNANAMIRKSLWEKNPYNEEITGLEDLEWAQRIIHSGYYLAYIAEADVIHVHNETPHEVFHRYYREAITLQSLFPDQKFHLRNFLWLWLLNTFSDYAYAIRERNILRNLNKIPLFRFMQFWGTYRGYDRHDPVGASLRKKFYYPNLLSQKKVPQIANYVPPPDYINYSTLL